MLGGEGTKGKKYSTEGKIGESVLDGSRENVVLILEKKSRRLNQKKTKKKR